MFNVYYNIFYTDTNKKKIFLTLKKNQVTSSSSKKSPNKSLQFLLASFAGGMKFATKISPLFNFFLLFQNENAHLDFFPFLILGVVNIWSEFCVNHCISNQVIGQLWAGNSTIYQMVVNQLKKNYVKWTLELF